VQLKTVHTAPWFHYPNENVSSNHLNWPYDSPHSEIGRSCVGKGRVSKTAARQTDNECSSVGDERTVVGQITRGIAGQEPVDESRNIEHDALPHRKSVQLAEHR